MGNGEPERKEKEKKKPVGDVYSPEPLLFVLET